MAIYYVLERVLQAKHFNDGDATERLKWFDSCYTVESATSYAKKFIYIFKEYEPAIFELNNNLGIENSSEVVILRQISAWTSRGAAKKCMRGEGIVLYHPTTEEIEAKKRDSLVGKVLLHVIENYPIPPEQLHLVQEDIENTLAASNGNLKTSQ